MTININYLAVVGAAIFSIVLGFFWYGPLFGKKWIALSSMTNEKIASMKKSGMTKNYLLMTAGTLLMSYVLAHALIFASEYTKITGIQAGIMAGLWNWLGFIAPVTLGAVLWEGKSWKLWLLNNAFYLVSLIGMGIILALWK